MRTHDFRPLISLNRLADYHDPASLASSMRRRRFAIFSALSSEIPRGGRVLDVGGTPDFWADIDMVHDGRIKVTLINLQDYTTTHANVECVVGDARDMSQFDTGAFDAVFSNSVIEHVGAYDDQRRMADEVQRVGRRYFVQTPNRYFPLEPHVLVPFFQFYPLRLRVELARRFQLGRLPRWPAYDDALREVGLIRLLSASEMRRLFPGAKLYRERFVGLTKSLVAYGGWGPERA